jgi:hypothetical protein
MHMVTVKDQSGDRSPTMRNSSATARGDTPGSSAVPSIVNVLPDPVWPYAKTHTL